MAEFITQHTPEEMAATLAGLSDLELFGSYCAACGARDVLREFAMRGGHALALGQLLYELDHGIETMQAQAAARGHDLPDVTLARRATH
ncbi:hypothetical protein [Burkholderia gladioli]|uniref:hypothetical protein n=1 Tax=Burkholderia gladioli TaxID=28095 RepID=UPI001641B5CD|nr:hypothetical protein [Burkholderia gladioli]MBJ9659837.1 hypothetical protein [Burkholderia gladioli]